MSDIRSVSLRLQVVRRAWVVGYFNNAIHCEFVSKVFEIMEGSQLSPQASLPKSLVNNDEALYALISSLFSSWLKQWLCRVGLMKLKMLKHIDCQTLLYMNLVIISGTCALQEQQCCCKITILCCNI